MNISASFSTMNLHTNYTSLQTNKSEKGNDKQLSFQMQEQSFSYSYTSFEFQSGIADNNFQADYEEFQSFLEGIGYNGGPIAELSQDEAAELVSEDGFFGVTQTSERIANFVLNGAGDNEDLLRAGRAGILQGFNEAEAMWGGKLPDISYQTIEKAVEMIDMRMHELGYSIITEEI
ncbi:MAG: hypothetical protein U9Q62_03940 [Campylobacterota bacterium]|nr:hypothetical protein [Campylobacterota bacterium]